MSTTNKLIVRVIVEQGIQKPVERGVEVEYINNPGQTVNFEALAQSTLEGCIKTQGIIQTIDGQQVVMVTPILQPKPKQKGKK